MSSSGSLGARNARSSPGPSVRTPGASPQDEVRHESHLPGVVAALHGDLPHTRVRHQRGLDLPGLHPVAADLQLMIDPADELHDTVGAPARQVAGPIDPGSGFAGEPIRNEPVRGLPWIVEIPPRDGVAPDHDLTR